jgi:hypothetical protein
VGNGPGRRSSQVLKGRDSHIRAFGLCPMEQELGEAFKQRSDMAGCAF